MSRGRSARDPPGAAANGRPVTEDDISESPDGAEAERWGWIAWGLLVAVGVALYEILHQPALLGVTISLKFAWGDARTAFWLRARDPDLRRGLANLWVYLGYGLWKAAISAFLLSFVFIALDQAIHGKGANRPAGQKDDTLIMIFAGSCGGSFFTALLSGAVCCVGFVLALRTGAKIWLNSRVAASRVRDAWPPEGGDANQLAQVALTSALLCSALIVGSVAVAIALLFPANVKPQAKGVAVVATFGVMILMPVLALSINDRVKKRLLALSPNEAWPGEESGS